MYAVLMTKEVSYLAFFSPSFQILSKGQILWVTEKRQILDATIQVFHKFKKLPPISFKSFH